jgi:uncharacterized protein
MFYNVAQLLKEPVGSTRTYSIDETIPTGDGNAQDAFRGTVSLLRTDKGIWLSAGLDGHVWLVCGRCLKNYSYPMKLAIDEEYLPTVDIATGQSFQLPSPEEGTFTVDRRHILSLMEAVRQYTITNQPMQPLCRKDCQGLCPVCGSDKNESVCICEERAAKPRWTLLLKLIDENSL